MSHHILMRKLAKWHIWLGWLAAIPLLIWTISGLVMVAKPIEEVRGEDLRAERATTLFTITLGAKQQPITLSEGRIITQNGRPILLATSGDGAITRYALDAQGPTALPPITEAQARAIAAKALKPGSAITGAVLYPAGKAPFEFRKDMPVWQLTLTSGAHIYIGRDTGELEAVRTPYWRFYDFMWGLHIMDPVAREDTHHPLIIISVIIGLASCVIGAILLFRRRKAKTK